MTYVVRFTREAEDDLLRLFNFLVERDPAAARMAQGAISEAIRFLGIFPFSCRKAEGGDGSPFLRELLIPFGSGGYVALFEIENERRVTILAVRHQREDDYH